MLTLLPVALLPTTGLAWSWLRMRQALTAEQATRRVTEAAIARDHAALTDRLLASARAHDNKQAVLDEADAVLTHALTQHSTQHGSGDTP